MGLGRWLFGGRDKKETERSRREIQEQQDRNRANVIDLTQLYKDQLGPSRDDLNLARQREAEIYPEIYKGYSGLANRTNRDNPAFSGYEEFSRTGGISPEDRAKFTGYESDYNRFANTGGMSPEEARRMRGNGIYEEASQTGLYTPSDIAAYRARAGSGIPSLFESLRGELTRRNTVQSGINPGYTSQMSRLTRDTGRESTRALNEAEIGLQEAIRGGRRWGTEGLTSSEAALQARRAANFLAGKEGAVSTAFGLTDRTNQGRLAGLGGLRGVESDTNALRTAGLGGLSNLRSTSNAGLNSANDQLMRVLAGIAQSYGLDASTAAQLLGLNIQNNPVEPGHLDQISRLISAAASAAGAGGGVKGGRQAGAYPVSESWFGS